MIPRACVLFLLSVKVCASYAWEPFNEQVEAQRMVERDSYESVDFLEPAAAGLTESSPCLITFDELPSFEPERHWCVTLTQSSAALSSWLKDVAITGREPKRSERTVAISPELLQTIRRIWLDAILDSRYSRFPLEGADGTIYLFGAARFVNRNSGNEVELIRAKAYSPRPDLPPRWLQNAGDRIFAYAQSSTRDEQQLRLVLVQLHDRLIAYYRQHRR